MSKLLEELKKYKESCRDDTCYVIDNEAESLVFASLEEIERLEQIIYSVKEMCASEEEVSERMKMDEKVHKANRLFLNGKQRAYGELLDYIKELEESLDE